MKQTFLFFLLAAVATGCSGFLDVGDGESKTPAAGSPDASTAPTSPPAALAQYCSARDAYTNRCKSALSSCAAAQSAACTETFGVYRNEYLEALTRCGFPADCAEGESSATISGCLADARDAIAPTAAMKELATALCAACPLQGETTCPGEKFYFHGRRHPDGSVSVSGRGASFDVYTDSAVEAIRTACIPKAKGTSCSQVFYDCIEETIGSLRPASVEKACAVTPAIPG